MDPEQHCKVTVAKNVEVIALLAAPYQPHNHTTAISFSLACWPACPGAVQAGGQAANRDNPSRSVLTISLCAGLSVLLCRASVRAINCPTLGGSAILSSGRADCLSTWVAPQYYAAATVPSYRLAC